ncbi:hypothetical protein [Kitasatospora sp. Root107]|uniref:hypothetical protein n=1 Tax=Kitasatospora sp. Root107 TaxID=1736424 RepID=UPI000A58000A|nr:hypothetical protein [Kitasatospora sp. Root107]
MRSDETAGQPPGGSVGPERDEVGADDVPDPQARAERRAALVARIRAANARTLERLADL